MKTFVYCLSDNTEFTVTFIDDESLMRFTKDTRRYNRRYDNYQYINPIGERV